MAPGTPGAISFIAGWKYRLCKKGGFITSKILCIGCKIGYLRKWQKMP